MQSKSADADAVDTALAEAARKGFRLAMIGRCCALTPAALFYFSAYSFPNNVIVGALILASAGLGLAPLLFVRTRFEHAGRFGIFAIDAAAMALVVAVAPISSGGEIPQNLVFFTGRAEYFILLIAVSALTLSPALVLWTGTWVVASVLGATAWIAAGMDRIVTFADMPPTPSPWEFIVVTLDPDFLGISVKLVEAGVLAVATGIVALAVYRARNVVRAQAAAEAGRARIQQLFGRYVPAQVAEQLIDEGQLAPQQREASILFADIAGFTHLSETLPPARVIALVNSFFGEATAAVDACGGVVVNYVGDALIASFNAPLPVEGHAAQAVEAAGALHELVSRREFEGQRLVLRIGIATGPVAAGTVGGSERQTYTLYGDTVNLAQRLEELNKSYDTACLICGATFAAAGLTGAEASAIGALEVRGRDREVEVYSLGAAAASSQRSA